MQAIRLTFKKLDSLKYISHLDLNRLFMRMIKRCHLHIWYTQGYNPHAHIVFSPPVSVGVSSLCEIADIKLLDDLEKNDILTALNSVSPSGILFVSAKEPVNKINKIAYAKYNISIKTTTTVKELENLKKSDRIIVVKKTKTKEIDFDIKPYYKDIEFKEKDGFIDFEVILPSSNDLTVKVDLLLSVIKDITDVKIQREEFLDENFDTFI
ncbi:MAG: TIGR03936 family radical SAM-associated protein [Clostridia bacterium]